MILNWLITETQVDPVHDSIEKKMICLFPHREASFLFINLSSMEELFTEVPRPRRNAFF